MISTKPMKVCAVVAAIVMSGLTHPQGAVGQGVEAFQLTGAEVAVYNLAGEARIVQGSGSAVVVRITRGGADALELDVQVGDIGGRETLRVIYPSDRIVYPALNRGSNSSFRVRADGTFGNGGRGGDRVDIRGSGSGLEAYADLEIAVPAGRELSLYLAVGSTDVRGVVGDFLIDTGSGSVVAEDIQGSLSVDTGSGSVSVLSVAGDVSVDTGSGGVDINDVRGGTINVDTGSGSVEGAGLSAPSLRIDTGSGGISLERVESDDILLDTGSGSVSLELMSDITNLDIDTGSGSVTVWLTEAVGAQVDIETGSGGIDLDFPIQVRRVSRDHVQGSFGDGEGRIRIEAGSGRVRLMRL